MLLNIFCDDIKLLKKSAVKKLKVVTQSFTKIRGKIKK